MDDPRIGLLLARLDRYERQARRRRRLALAACVLAALGARPADDAEQERDHATAIAGRRLEVSRQALAIIGASAGRGAPVANAVADIYEWSYRMLGDQIYLSMSRGEPRVEDAEVFLAVSPARFNPDRLAAFEAHHQRMVDWENRLRPLVQKGTLSRLDFLQVQAHRLQAELLLARERIKEPKG